MSKYHFFLYLLIATSATASPATKKVELPTAAPKIEKFQLNKAEDVVNVMQSNSTKNQELLPILQQMLTTINKTGNVTSEGFSLLQDMMVNFSRQAEHTATENNQTLTEDELKQVLSNLGMKEGDTNYEVIKTKEGNVKIIVEEIETDDPTAKDEIYLDYKKTLDKTVTVDGAEQEDDSA